MAGFTGGGGKRPASGSRALGGDKGAGGNVGKRIVNAGGAPASQGGTALNGGPAGKDSVAGGTVKVTPVTQQGDQGPEGN